MTIIERTTSEPLVVELHDGDRSMAGLLGGKGAGLAEMTRLGLPVPPGFIVTTEACRAYLASGGEPDGLWGRVEVELVALEERSGLRLGDPRAAPALGALRRPVLDARDDGDHPQRRDDRRGRGRASPRGGPVRVGLLPPAGADVRADRARRRRQALRRRLHGERQVDGVDTDAELDAEHLKRLTSGFRAIIREHTGEDCRRTRASSCTGRLAVFGSWNGDRARLYRRHEDIADDLGTAVNVVQMVFGNRGDRSGSGVCFTRDPVTGAPAPSATTSPTPRARTSSAGRAPDGPLGAARRDPGLHRAAQRPPAHPRDHYRDLCDVEFTVERGRLWILQTRLGKRSPAAAFRIAVEASTRASSTSTRR